jgi:hypothetical protein
MGAPLGQARHARQLGIIGSTGERTGPVPGTRFLVSAAPVSCE